MTTSREGNASIILPSGVMPMNLARTEPERTAGASSNSSTSAGSAARTLRFGSFRDFLFSFAVDAMEGAAVLARKVLGGCSITDAPASSSTLRLVVVFAGELAG